MRFSYTTSKICLVTLCLLPLLATGSPQFDGANFCMKEIMLTRGRVAIVDDEDFEYLNQWKWQAHGKEPHLYAYRGQWKNGSKKGVSMHRLIMRVTDVSVLVDHKDLDTLNNQKVNLRTCTRSQNNANTRCRKNALSKYLGVSLFKKHKNDKGKWRATIGKDKKIYHLGYFKTQELAAIAYNKKALELHGEFANLNQV